MDWLRNLLFIDGNLLGIEWNAWKVVGMTGNALFFSRFFVQWYATEKHRQIVVPVAFWWLSLAGSGLLLAYALCYRQDAVFVLAYAFTWIPYIRNLVIHHRSQSPRPSYPHTHTRFCPHCGHPLNALPVDSAKVSSKK